MVFELKKSEAGYEYKTEQFVGIFKFTSDSPISNATLDALVLALSSMPSCEGDETYKGQVIKYSFQKKELWYEDEKQELEEINK